MGTITLKMEKPVRKKSKERVTTKQITPLLNKLALSALVETSFAPVKTT